MNKAIKSLFLTPPMTQLNTAYPATAYITGFLRKEGYDVAQRDMAIEVLLSMLTTQSSRCAQCLAPS